MMDRLPQEILVSIFKLLPLKALKSAVLVSTSWKEVVEDPSFWTRAMVIVDTEKDIKKLSYTRFMKIKEIQVTHGCKDYGWGMGVRVAKLLKAVDQIPTVRKIPGLGMCTGISGVNPGLVGRVLNRLAVVMLGDNYDEDYEEIPLTTGQMERLFSNMGVNTSVKNLGVYCDISEISPEVFTAAISNVEVVTLAFEFFSSQQQMEALYSAIMGGGGQLKKLTVRMNHYSIDYETMGRALNMLEEVEIHDADSEQAAAVLRNLVRGETRLKRLRFIRGYWGDLSGVDQELIRRGREKVDLSIDDY